MAQGGAWSLRRVAARALLLAISVPCWSAGALAQVPLGREFRVDTSGDALPFTFFGGPRSSAMSRDGEFVIAWTRAATPSPSTADVMARHFDAGGRPRGPEIVVNSFTTGFQYGEAVGMDDAGNFVVVWWGQDAAGTGVSGRRFAASGAPLGAEFRLGDPFDSRPSIAVAPGGEFVVVWTAYDGSSSGIFGQRYDASGSPAGGRFQVNTITTNEQSWATVDVDGSGDFVVVWMSVFGSRSLGQRFSAAGIPQGAEFEVRSSPGLANRPRVARSRSGPFTVVWSNGVDPEIYARRFDANGQPVGDEFQINVYTTGDQKSPEIDVDADGGFVVTWTSQQAGSWPAINGRRFSAAGAGGAEFQVSSYTSGYEFASTVATDPAGNFVVAWYSLVQVPTGGVFARRYAGGLSPVALAVDSSAGPTSDGNSVFEAGETVAMAPTWLNADFATQTFGGTAWAFTGPGTGGDPTYTIADAAASYGAVASGATGSCTATADCYALGISIPATRPALHWDASVREDIAPASTGATKPWTLHVGESFGDVPRSSPFYRFVETLLHHDVTGGCTASTYCPSLATTREQMAVFVLVAKEGTGYMPPACGTPVFDDVPASSSFCPWIEELARRGVVTGCGGGNYCPTSAVSREQMAVFVLRTLDPALAPPACGTPVFGDVPAASPFCRWIEELARRGVVTGCGGGNYCPSPPVAREQMGVFIGAGFTLALYGP